MAKTIYFDMDGTLANLYQVENWLDKLRAYDTSPYLEAAVMLNMQSLAHRLNKLQTLGYRLGIITWLSAESTNEYDQLVIEAKIKWLNIHLNSVNWDEMHFLPFGTKKSEVAKNGGYLFDDNLKIRKEWVKSHPDCWAFDEKNILQTLELFK